MALTLAIYKPPLVIPLSQTTKIYCKFYNRIYFLLIKIEFKKLFIRNLTWISNHNAT